MTGTWCTSRRSPSFRIQINGREVSAYTNAVHTATGPIGLQVHEGMRMTVEFRNIRVCCPPR